MARTLLLPNEVDDMFKEFRDNELLGNKARGTSKPSSSNRTSSYSRIGGEDEIVETDEESTVASDDASSLNDEQVLSRCKESKGSDILATEMIAHEAPTHAASPEHASDLEPTLKLPPVPSHESLRDKDCGPATRTRARSGQDITKPAFKKKKGVKKKKSSGRKKESAFKVYNVQS